MARATTSRFTIGIVLLLIAIDIGYFSGMSEIDFSTWRNQNFLTEDEQRNGWILLFDGKTLNGWKPNENPSSFVVRHGTIVAQGLGNESKESGSHPKCHLFYLGPEGSACFQDFEFQVDFKSEDQTNSGIYFHTEYIENAWPQKGFEIQIDNDPAHPKKTGSLYAVQDLSESPAKDNQWVHLQLTVQGRRIVIKVNDQSIVDWTQPDNFLASNPPAYTERKLSNGTFALQSHGSKGNVYFRNLRMKLLSNESTTTE